MSDQQPHNASPPHSLQVQYETSNEFPQQPTQSTCNRKRICTKINLLRLLVILLSTTCLIYTAVIISLSSNYFFLLFSYTDENTSKAYLSQYYGPNLAFLYISTVGFVMMLANTIIFFVRFSFKNKMIYMHLVLLICYCVSGAITVANNDYVQMMVSLLVLPPGGAVCFTRTYIFECFLVSPFLTYREQLTAYYITFLILFVIFTAIYHYGAYTLTLNAQQQKQKEKEEVPLEGLKSNHLSQRNVTNTKEDISPTREKPHPET